MISLTNLLKKDTTEYESKYRKAGDNTLVIILIFLAVSSIIGIAIYNNSIKSKCNNFEKETIDLAFKFAMNNNILPSYEGTKVKINLSSVPGWDNNFRNSSCDGTLTIIKNNEGYAKVLDLTGCNKCTSSNKSLTSETTTFDADKVLLKISVTYNYQTREISYSSWTNWYESSLISPTASANNINLPYDEENLPKIPENAEVISYEVEKKTFYSYRDQSWKFYKTANNNYSEFSSTKPADYAYKDAKTEIETDYSSWSTNYPEEAEYRTITKATGYRYYYTDEDGDKIYYNDGAYTVKIEDKTLADLYDKKDDDSVSMYRYKDSMWRWYNGTERGYSSYMNLASTTYPYKDTGITKYTNWSDYKETSSITYDNSSYREEKTDIHSRYRTKYAINSMELLNEYLNIEDFETATGRAVSDMQNDENIKVTIKYTYQYEK
ncbi:MAG: hypothetical protein PHD02_01795 [Bacilli bacterium]|nr:hypothetical protein [Bacilli bacterium]